MFAYSLPSYHYPTVPRHGYGYYSPSFNYNDRYFDALAEARAAEEELRAQAAARREEQLRAELAARQEEEILRRRLQALQQSRLPQYSAYPFESSYSTPLRPFESRLDSLRLQVEEEERQLAKLEALRRRRLELEQEEIRRREIEENLMHWGRRPAVPQIPETTINVYSRPNTPQGCPVYPETRTFPYGKIAQPGQPKLFVQPPSDKSKYVRFTIDQDELPRQSQPQPEPRKEQPSTSGQAIDLGDFLQQLGFSGPKAGNRPQAPKAPEQPKATNVQQPKTSEKPSTPRESATPHSFPVLDLGQILNLLSNAGQEQKKQPSPSTTEVPRSKSPQTTLREDLEKRLNNEHANEVRDTIQAILESLKPHSTPTRQPSTSTPSAPASRVPVSSDKGKAKEVPVPTSEPRPLSPIDYSNATERVQAIENRFHVLESEFAFPAKLDFVPIPSPTNNNTSGLATSHLAYTANNHPVRFYQQSLTYLLTQLDLIESFGNEELRRKRKEVVQKVEHALEDLEQEVEGRWNAKVARESKRHSVTVEDVTLEEEKEVGTPKSTATTHILEEEPRTEVVAPTAVSSTTSVPSTPAHPLEHVEEVTGASLPEQPETGVVAEEPVIIEPAKSESKPEPEAAATVEDSVTPTPLQEDFTPETNESAVVVEAELETIEETQTQPSPLESELVEQSPVEESKIVTPVSTESTSIPFVVTTATTTTTPLDSSEGDLSATIRPSSPINNDDGDVQLDSHHTESLVSEGNESDTDVDIDGDDEEDTGFLLQSGREASPKRDVSDVESNASDWSEVEFVPTH